jgi:hypothetical protein
MTNAEEMHTFDQRLLSFDGKIARADGTNLKICKPSMGGPPVPLLDTGAAIDEAGETAGEDASEDEPDVPVHVSGEGTGTPGGRTDARPGIEADSRSRASARTPSEEAAGDDLSNASMPPHELDDEPESRQSKPDRPSAGVKN